MQTNQPRRITRWLCKTMLLALACYAANAGVSVAAITVADVRHEGPVDFEKEILPILRRNCLACHSATDAEADLVLETPESILKGGETGPGAVAGRGAESLILKYAAHQADSVMPPEDNEVGAKNLSSEQLGLLRLWIDQGAKGEVTGSTAPIAWKSLPARVKPVYALDVSPHGKYVAAGRANQIWIHSVPSKRVLTRLVDPALVDQPIFQGRGAAHLDLVQSLTFSPDGKWLASGGYRTVKLWRRPTNPQKRKLAGIDGEPQSLAVSADGRWAAVGESTGTVKLLDIASGKAEKTIGGHKGAVTALAFSSDGALLATGSQDKTFRLVRLADGKVLGTVETPSPIGAIAFVLNGEQIATGHADSKLLTWRLPGESPKPVKNFEGHAGPVTSLISVVGGKQLLSGSRDGTVRLWDADTGKILRQFKHGGPVNAIAVSPDGGKIASASSNNTAKIFRFDNAEQIAELRGDHRLRLAAKDAARALAVAERHVENVKKDLEETTSRKASAEENLKKAEDEKTDAAELLKKKEEAAGPLVAEKEQAQQQLAAAKAKSDESGEAVKQAEKNVKQKTDAAKQALDERDAAKRALESAQRKIVSSKKTIQQLTDSLARLKAAEKDVQATVQKRASEKQQADQAITTGDRPWLAIAFSADGAQLATAGEDGLVHLWGSASGTGLDVFADQNVPITALAATPAGGLVALGRNGSAIVWDTAAPWRLARTIGSHDSTQQFADRVTALDFSPDSLLLATGGGAPSRSGELKIWKVEDGSLVREFKEAHSDTIFDVEFSPDGRQIASCSADRLVRIHEITGKLIRGFEGHTHHVTGVSWRADQRVLATSGADKTVKVWDVLTGDQRTSIGGWKRDVTSVKFVSTSDVMLTAAGDPQVSLHDTTGGDKGTFGGITDFIYTARVSADGETIAAGGQDGVVRVWNERRQTIVNFEPSKPDESE